MAPRQLISKITQAKTIEKPRAAAMPPSESQPVLPTPVPPVRASLQSRQDFSKYDAHTKGSQMCQNHILSSRKMTGPTTPQGLAIIIKPVPRSQFQSPLAQCKFQFQNPLAQFKFLTSHRTPLRRQPHYVGPTE